MPKRITYPIPLDETLQDLVVKTQEVASKIKTPQSDWDEKDEQSLAYVANKPDIYGEKTVTGNPIQITSGSTQSLSDVVVNIVLVQSGSGTPSPSNIRPISGFDAVILTVKDSEDEDRYVAAIQLGQTVYGGNLSLEDGVLTVTYGYIDSYDGETLPGEWVSDRDEYAAGTTPTTGAQVAYVLAEPVTSTLTGIPKIRLIKGVNSVSANSGSLTATYVDDSGNITELIDEAIALFASIATVENGNTASRAYAKGEYMIFKGSFCKVTANAGISSGGTITVGTNVAVTTIGAELKTALA